MITSYGAPGWGSVISEMMLTLAEIPYHFVDVSGFDSEGPQRDSLQQLNQLCQVPTLTLENGEVMTVTAAHALIGLDHRPALAPPAGHAEPHQFPHPPGSPAPPG